MGATANPSPTPPAATVTTGAYMVQLAAYSKPENADRSKAAGLGNIVLLPKGKLTAMLVSNISTIEEARNVRSRARTQGWTGAFIVIEQNGQLVKVE